MRELYGRTMPERGSCHTSFLPSFPSTDPRRALAVDLSLACLPFPLPSPSSPFLFPFPRLLSLPPPTPLLLLLLLHPFCFDEVSAPSLLARISSRLYALSLDLLAYTPSRILSLAGVSPVVDKAKAEDPESWTDRRA